MIINVNCGFPSLSQYHKDGEDMSDLSSLRNIGKELEKKLKSVGIMTAEELMKAGSEEAFVRLKLRYPNVCPVFLYALEGAISDTEYNQLPDDVKRNLKDFSDRFK